MAPLLKLDDLAHVDTWVFDLDNTLYDAENHVFVEVGERMTDFVARHLGLDRDAAGKVRKDYYKRYGTTLRGLMTENGVAPDDFLHHVHDIDISVVAQCGITQTGLQQLPGRRVVYTNAPRGFAVRMLDHLGIASHFDGIFAIEDAAYWPKPNPDSYRTFFGAHGVNPATACMFEDMEINLKTAHDLGMATVWFHGDGDHPAHPHVHHRDINLTQWLKRRLPT